MIPLQYAPSGVGNRAGPDPFPEVEHGSKRAGLWLAHAGYLDEAVRLGPGRHDAEELADAGETETLTEILAWVVPMLGAASEDPELRAREARLRARTRIYLDDGARQFVEYVVRTLPG